MKGTTIYRVRGKSTNGISDTLVQRIEWQWADGTRDKMIRLLRVTLETDNYEPQCHVSVEVLDPTTTKWNPLVWLQAGQMKSCHLGRPADILSDSDEALLIAIAILEAQYGDAS